MGLYTPATSRLGESGEVVSAEGCEKVEDWSLMGYVLNTTSPCPNKFKKQQRRTQLMLVFVCLRVVD